MNATKVLVIAALTGIASSLVTTLFVRQLLIQTGKLTDQDRIREFYLTENLVYVSPHSLRKQMAKGELNLTLVDLRSQLEYEKEHIAGAVNIPAYKDPDTSAYDEVDRIVTAFKALPQEKDIVVYCYSIPCMTGRKIGKILAEHDIYVKHLGIGWNEWRYFWNLWNHEHEWGQTKVEEYIVTGPEPGKPVTSPASLEPCSLNDTVGC